MSRLEVRKTYKLLIGGAYARTESGRAYSALGPKGELLAHVPLGSRKSSGRPLSGRFIPTSGLPRSFAFSAALPRSPRIFWARCSTSRTLVRYSSSFARSSPLIRRLRPLASSVTRSRMLSMRRLPLFSKRLSKASEG